MDSKNRVLGVLLAGVAGAGVVLVLRDPAEPVQAAHPSGAAQSASTATSEIDPVVSERLEYASSASTEPHPPGAAVGSLSTPEWDGAVDFDAGRGYIFQLDEYLADPELNPQKTVLSGDEAVALRLLLDERRRRWELFGDEKLAAREQWMDLKRAAGQFEYEDPSLGTPAKPGVIVAIRAYGGGRRAEVYHISPGECLAHDMAYRRQQLESEAARADVLAAVQRASR
jgi:hypothetical protein